VQFHRTTALDRLSSAIVSRDGSWKTKLTNNEMITSNSLRL